ncbi:MAG: hypothetical protein KGJ58_00275 [Patescibacteria group bacterium]|nr:hypothetical protein [Patescibacteria group bacterium]MDE1988390.1 hypothetical protein [Patescibacteria group bacterium]MDE2217878.1 hypothetical protein [Patescibacteria group bacterium]
MGKFIKENWLRLILGIIILILLVLLVVNQNELNQLKRQVNSKTSQHVYNLPTATEVFRLRSECATIGQKILGNNIIGSALIQSQVSHYNSETNRCYVKLTVQSANLSGDYFSNYLFDGQTGDLLVSATQQKGKKEYGIIFNGPAKTIVSDSSETTFQSTDDYINQVMHDDWKQ